MSHHPELEFIENDGHWLQWAEFSRLPTSENSAALAYAGLFTDYLASLGQGDVSVELIRQGRINDSDATSHTRRDVVIRVGERTAAVASTLIAPEVIAQYPWLNNLGGRAIGETLERKLGAVRTDICYAAIDCHSDLAINFSPRESTLWGRRYRYQFDGGELCITEVIAGTVITDIERVNRGTG